MQPLRSHRSLGMDSAVREGAVLFPETRPGLSGDGLPDRRSRGHRSESYSERDGTSSPFEVGVFVGPRANPVVSRRRHRPGASERRTDLTHGEDPVRITAERSSGSPVTQPTVDGADAALIVSVPTKGEGCKQSPGGEDSRATSGRLRRPLGRPTPRGDVLHPGRVVTGTTRPRSGRSQSGKAISVGRCRPGSFQASPSRMTMILTRRTPSKSRNS